MTLKNIEKLVSFHSLCSAASHRNASEVTTFKSENRFQDVEDKNSNEQIQKQNVRNVKPDKVHNPTDKVQCQLQPISQMRLDTVKTF